MPAISRRRFMRDASVGAAAVGTVAVVGPSAFGVATAGPAAAAPVGSRAASRHQSTATAPASGTDVMAHIVDDSSGTISLYSGTTKITVQDHALAEALLRSVR